MPEAVLIVDDDVAIALALTVRLEAAGYDVHHASNGRRGLASASALRPSLILLDVQMPDLDGFAVYDELRTRPELRETPVIFMSANARDPMPDRARASGAAGFIRKPYDASELIAAIGDAIAARRRSAAEGAVP